MMVFCTSILSLLDGKYFGDRGSTLATGLYGKGIEVIDLGLSPSSAPLNGKTSGRISLYRCKVLM
jgi:hypothetical protein